MILMMSYQFFEFNGNLLITPMPVSNLLHVTNKVADMILYLPEKALPAGTMCFLGDITGERVWCSLAFV